MIILSLLIYILKSHIFKELYSLLSLNYKIFIISRSIALYLISSKFDGKLKSIKKSEIKRKSTLKIEWKKAQNNTLIY